MIPLFTPHRTNNIYIYTFFSFFPRVVRGIKYEMVSREIYCSHIYAIHIAWMHNALRSLRPFRRQLYIKYTRHYKFISAILPELICSLGIARSSISSQRTFRTDLLSAGRRRRVQTRNYYYTHLSPFPPLGGSRLNLFLTSAL